MTGADSQTPPGPTGAGYDVSDRCWKMQLSSVELATFASWPPKTKVTALQAAWAIVLGRYCDAADIVFGAGVEKPDSTAAAEPLIVPVRLRLDPKKTVSDFLCDVCGVTQETSSSEEHFGLQTPRESPREEDTQTACHFSSVLTIRMADCSTKTRAATMTSYSRIVLLYDDVVVELYVDHELGLLANDRVMALSYHFNRVVQQLLSAGEAGNMLLRDVSLAGEWDLQQAIATNADTPETINDCVHLIFTRKAQQQPDAPAICAWDGNLTYGELDAAADRLARRLAGQVRAEVCVHVCFEKSVWFFVSILAINKAGGAWIPLDPLHPAQRLQGLVNQTKAKLALASTANVDLCKSLGLAVMEITVHSDKALVDDERRSGSPSALPSQLPEACKVTPRNAAYVLFTSGSTGMPKGLVIEHGSLCTSQVSLGKSLGLTSETRFLQFASYVFDSCIGEIIATLLVGGCVCVPSEETRWTGIPDFIRDARVNSALLTPSFIRTMKPADVPGLRLLVTASEPAGHDMLNIWLGHVRLFNAWGPAEICCLATVHEWHSADESPMTIGTPMGGSRSWIVDPENHEQLAPIGCVGELVVQGPTILREYLSNPQKTEESIMTPVPSWMRRGRSGTGWDRCFRTGDLAFYDAAGRIQFVGRKDLQVKVRGQRVELGEIEFHILRILELRGIRQVAVDVSRTEAATALVAYLCFSWDTKRASEDEQDNMDDLFLDQTNDMAGIVSDLADELRVKLPNYMVPTVFLPCRYMPYTTKLDRKTLRRKTASLHRDRIARYSRVDPVKQAPETVLERQMQQLWASILNVPAQSIGRHDNFLQIGGDSISAIRLISLARSTHGMVLTMASIFQDARLSHLAATADSAAAVGAPPPPFSLLPDGCTREILDQALRQCGPMEEAAVDNVYPCTPLQEGLMALAVTQPGSYLTAWVYRLSSHVDCTRFQRAWERTVARCDGLRTRIIVTDRGSFQVVVKDDVAWEACSLPGAGAGAGAGAATSTLDWAVEQTRKVEIAPGSRLWRYALAEDADGAKYFTLIGHHAAFDGWSIGLVMQQLLCAYQETPPPALEPFSRFMQYLHHIDRDASARYWTAQLHDARRTAFPRRQAGVANTNIRSELQTLTRCIGLPPAASSITRASLVRATWAIVLARYCETDDVCFAASVSGRHAPVPGLESECGPAVATVPVRLRLDPQQRAADFLQHVQVHASAATLHEQFGLQHISQLSDSAREACDFAHVLVVHPAEILDGLRAVEPFMSLVSRTGMKSASYEYFGYPLVVHAFLRENDVEFYATYDVAWIVEAQVAALLHHVDHVVQQLLAPGRMLLRDICIAGPWDLQQATLWNQEGPEAINDCFHYMIAKKVEDQPDAPAICAWDGKLSYLEFDRAADRLARHLVRDHGVAVEEMVHVCFEKSLWFYVSILAISKAGGAWVPLDPSHPIERQQEIARQTGARLVLTSATNASRFVGQTVVEVTAALDKTMTDDEANMRSLSRLPQVTAQNAAYVLFTSGSTGTPKGLIMEHGSLCTSMVADAIRLGLTSDIRMLQFASYAFDVFVFESISFLLSGACICVPSETDRLTDLEGFINTTAVTWADLTPSFARTIDSSKVPGLKGLVVGGEPAGQDIINTWVGSGVRLINAYGPAETCVISACYEYISLDDSPQTIGRPVGGSCWIVEPEDHERLAPIGCVGEIVVQGPIVLREYLADPEKTQAAVKTVPSWMPRRTEAKYDRLYKTGDLAHYNPDGTIEFIGRKDLQLKIRGQRIESGEVEHHIQAAWGGIEQVAVDVFRTEAGATSLVAYIYFGPETSPIDSVDDCTAIRARDVNGTSAAVRDTDHLFMPLSDQMEKRMRIIARELKRKLPGYMVPSMFIPCQYMPFITTTKLDRKKLRQKTAELDAESTARYSLVGSEEKQSPQTAEEMQLRRLWASVLKVPAETIGRDDSFLQVGGDSVTAIRLVLLARREGITLTVPSILQDGRLSHLATKSSKASSSR